MLANRLWSSLCNTKLQLGLKRGFQTSSVYMKTTAGRIKTSRFLNKALTYDQGFLPEDIMKMKGLLAHHTGNLHEENNAFQFMFEDMVIRKFMRGTFYRLIAGDEIVIKRRFNVVEISMFCSNVVKRGHTELLHAYSERLLSAFLKCIVKIHIFQARHDDMVFKYIWILFNRKLLFVVKRELVVFEKNSI